MGLIGKEIIQSRTWIDPNAPKPPELNYKETYPITIYEAVKESMEDNSPNLKDLLNIIYEELQNRQKIIQSKPANYIMTFAGTPGAVGSIQITREIPWDPTLQKHDKIPTERAVGELLMKLGLVDEEGNIDPDGGKKIRWADIIGRPNIYYELGMNEDGFVIQKAITVALDDIKYNLNSLSDDTDGKFIAINSKTDNHIANQNNPHNITLDQIDAVSKEALEFHTSNFNNPHNTNKDQIGLSNADNTSDIDKPISTATQNALDLIKDIIKDIKENDIGDFIIDAKYDQPSGILILILKNGSEIKLYIPIDGLVDCVSYDKNTKELIITELSGSISKVDVSDLFIRYLGGITSNITIITEDTQEVGIKTIKASINNKSITDNEMADNSIITRTIKDQNVTNDKIKDLSITTNKLVDKSVTTNKLDDLAVTTTKIMDRSINEKKLFSSIINNRVLGVVNHGSDPEWLQVNSDMLCDNVVKTIHISNDSITTNKLVDKSVTTNKLDDLAVTTTKIMDLVITNEKICNSTITGTKLISDILFIGTPRITQRPLITSNNNQIADTYWVNEKLDKVQIKNDNLLNRSVDGRVLFSSPVDNKALIVLSANSDPIWGLINNGMMDSNSISTNNIINDNITDSKIASSAIKSRHISDSSILTNHIKNGEITSTNIWKSETANRVIAVLTNDSHPVYTQVKREMLINNIIGSNQIEDRSVTLSKLTTSDKSNRILGVVLKNTDPIWMQATNEMIADRAINGRTLFSSPEPNRVLAVTDRSIDPAWIQVTGDMIKDKTINGNNISENSIFSYHLRDRSVESRHILDRTIKSINIEPNAITGIELFTSSEPNRVLGVTTPYSNPEWMQLTGDMIKNGSITQDKIFRSAHPYRVLGVTQGDVPPEYLKITSDFIVDDSIIPQKLIHNFVLYGVPETTERPTFDADNRQIPDTFWVRKTVANMIKDFNPEILFDKVTKEMIADRAIDGTKLFTHPQAPRVIGITHPNEDPEFILIEEDLIVDGAVTKKKIQRDLPLLGSPTIEVRPFFNASDASGGGNLIPDCQWVLDTIGSTGGGISRFDPEYFIETSKGLSLNIVNIMASRGEIDDLFNNSGGGDPGGGGGDPGGGGGDILGFESVTTKHLANRAVTGDKMFTSPVANKLLGVFAENTSPQYIQAINDMIANRAIDGRTLFTSGSSNKVLGVLAAGSDPIWLQINHDMMDKNSVGTYQLRDDNVTNSKVANRAIDGRTIFSSTIPNRVLGVTAVETDPSWLQINYNMMGDNSVGTNNLRNDSVTTPKLADYSVTETKLATNPIISTSHLLDKSVTTPKLADKAVTNTKITNSTIQGDKLVDNIVLPGHPTVKAHTSYQTRSLRNTIISSDAPSGGENGDIWLRYI